MTKTNNTPRFKFLSRLIPLAGVIGLAVILWFFMSFLHPNSSTTEKISNIAIGYGFILLLIFSWQSLIENAIVLSLCNILLFTLLFATGNALSETTRLLVWSLLATIWYLPLFLFSMHFLNDPENADETNAL